jgi:hypothetical protein
MLCSMVGRKVDGRIGGCGCMVDTKSEYMVKSVHCKVQVCNNIVKFSGVSKVYKWLYPIHRGLNGVLISFVSVKDDQYVVDVSPVKSDFIFL